MKKTFLLGGLDCANCAARIEHKISALDGVNQATVNFITAKMVIEGEDAKFDPIIKAATDIVHKVEPVVVIKKV